MYIFEFTQLGMALVIDIVPHNIKWQTQGGDKKLYFSIRMVFQKTDRQKFFLVELIT